MRVIGILLIIFAFESLARAGSAESGADDLRSVIRHRSAAELNRFLQSKDLRNRNRGLCDVQLRHERVPFSCFELESIAPEWLPTLFKKRIAASHDFREISSALKVASLPVDCRKAAADRLADLRYVEASDHPADLLAKELAHDL